MFGIIWRFQLIPQISSLTYVTTIVPLVAVLTVTALKDAYDDIVSPVRVVLWFPVYDTPHV